MAELAIMMALIGTAFVLAYISSQISEENSVMRIFFTSFSMIFLLGAPLTAMRFASENGYPQVEGYMTGFLTAVVFMFVFWVAFLVWMYIRDTSKMMYGETQDAFGEDKI